MKSIVMEHFKNLCIVLRLGTMNTGTALIPLLNTQKSDIQRIPTCSGRISLCSEGIFLLKLLIDLISLF